MEKGEYGGLNKPERGLTFQKMSKKEVSLSLRALFKLSRSEACHVFKYPVEGGFGIEATVVGNGYEGEMIVFCILTLNFKIFHPVMIYKIEEIALKLVVEYTRKIFL